MSSMNKLIILSWAWSAAAACVWAANSFLHEGPGGPPMPGTHPGSAIVTPAPSAQPQDIKLPSTQPAQPASAVVMAQQPSYLFIKYLPEPNSPDGVDALASDFGTAHRFPAARLRVFGSA